MVHTKFIFYRFSYFFVYRVHENIGDCFRKYIRPNFNSFPITGVIFLPGSEPTKAGAKTVKELIENAWLGPEKTVSRHLDCVI